MQIVLVVEDLADEQEKAKQALVEAGFKPAVTSTLGDAFRIWKSLEGKLAGVITDLHFPEKTSNDERGDDPNKPCGLAIIAEATQTGMPIVVCSDINHHFAEYVNKVISVFELYHPLKRIPFVMDRKDWKRATEELKNLLDQKGEAE